jgi:hypothetical protein
MAAMPEVRVREPPGRIMSYFRRAVHSIDVSLFLKSLSAKGKHRNPNLWEVQERREQQEQQD